MFYLFTSLFVLAVSFPLHAHTYDGYTRVAACLANLSKENLKAPGDLAEQPMTGYFVRSEK